MIVPYINEYPQVLFTLQSILCEVKDIDAEIIAVDNGSTDKGKTRIEDISKLHNGRIKSMEYTEKLSHWQAKNTGVDESKGELLFFVDAHCMIEPGALRSMLDEYRNGTLHLPIRYILDNEKSNLMYRLIDDPEKGIFHYTFQRTGPMKDRPVRVDAMSSCGMMISRSLFDRIGGFPRELGIYGGGENFICGAMRVLDLPMYLHNKPCVYHYAEKRGYSWNYDDWLRNRMIAAYIPFGEEFVRRFAEHSKGNEARKNEILEDVLLTCKDHRMIFEEATGVQHN